MTSNRFSFFSGLDIRSIGLFRILLGIALLIDIITSKLPYYRILYSDNGLLPGNIFDLIYGKHQYFLLKYIGSEAGVLFFFIVLLIACLFIIAGYRSQIACIIAYIFLTSIEERTPTLTHGYDQVFRMLTFWGAFLPLDTAFGIRKTTSWSPKNPEVKNWTVWGILIQIAIIYCFNAWAKSGEAWKEGTAVAYAAMIPAHRGPLAEWLLQAPVIYKTLTYLTLIWEYSMPLLLFFPFLNRTFRLIAAASILFFHWGLLFFLITGNFFLATAPIVALLLPTAIWNKLSVNIPANTQLSSTILSPVMRGKNILACLAISLILFINAGAYHEQTAAFLNTLYPKTMNLMGLKQRWILFAPEPGRINQYILILGQLEDNTVVDLKTGTPYEKMDIYNDPYTYYTMPYQYTYIQYIYKRVRHAPIGKLYANNWCNYELQQWNRKHPDNKVKTVYLINISFSSIAPGKITTPQTRQYHQYQVTY